MPVVTSSVFRVSGEFSHSAEILDYKVTTLYLGLSRRGVAYERTESVSPFSFNFPQTLR